MTLVKLRASDHLIEENTKSSLGDLACVEHADGAGGRVSGVREGLEALGGPLFVVGGEVLPVEDDHTA